MNHVVLIGNLCQSPEARTTQSGIAVSSFRVAVQRRFRNANGQREADFINCVAWRNTADFVNKYMKKGSKVAIEGSIQTRTYDAQDGSKRHIVEVLVDNIEGLDRRDDSAPKPAAKSDANSFVEVDPGEELPF